MKQYTIVGDHKDFGECLVCIVYGGEENANKALHRMLTNPTENDLELSKDLKNLRVKAEETKDCWWAVYGTN